MKIAAAVVVLLLAGCSSSSGGSAPSSPVPLTADLSLPAVSYPTADAAGAAACTAFGDALAASAVDSPDQAVVDRDAALMLAAAKQAVALGGADDNYATQLYGGSRAAAAYLAGPATFAGGVDLMRSLCR